MEIYISRKDPIIISKEKQKEIIEYYLSNKITLTDIANHFCIGIRALKKIVKDIKRDKISKGNTKIDKSKYEDIKNMYFNLSTIHEIAAKYSVATTTINGILNRCGIKLRSFSEYVDIKRRKNMVEYYHKTKSLSECIEKFKSTNCSRFEIIEILSEYLTINDELIITIFYSNNRLNSTITNHYFCGSNLTEFENKVVDYINNRFKDSKSLKETFYRIFYKKYERPLCAECYKNPVHFTNNKFVFTKFCGRKCSRNNEETVANYHKALKDTYGDENYNNTEKNQQTCLRKYGKTNVFATDWCKKKIENYWMDNYGVRNPNQVEEIKNKHNFEELCKKGNETKRKNKTFNTSKPEEDVYALLVSKFGVEDIERQYNKDKRYPFQCDFYIRSLDTFVEYNGHWTHGKHPYNPSCKEDIEIVEKWKSRCEKNDFYKVAIHVWTEHDVKKRNFAMESKIKYVELWNMKDVEEFVS